VNPGYVALPFLVSAIVVGAVTPMLIRLARNRGLYDRVGERKVHDSDTPRLGGLAIFIGIAAAGAGAMLWGDYHFTGRLARALSFGILPVFTVSLWDDLRPLPWWVKLSAQTAGATLFAVLIPPIERLNLPFVGTFNLGIWSYPLVVGWLLLVTNAMNFIDGLDGLAVGVAAIAGSVMLISSVRVEFVVTTALASALVGACLGFLPYNFHPARVFMGDSGSTTLGFILGVLALVGAGKNIALVSLLLPILALGLPLVDTLVAVVRRTYRGRSIFKADREHIHHVLLSLGLGHRRTVVLMYLIAILLGGLGLFLATGPRLSVVFVVILGLASFLLLFERRSGRD